MPRTNGLSWRERIFVEAFLELGNATEAALRAGYSPRSARQTASEVLQKPHIKPLIEAARGSVVDLAKARTPSKVGFVYVIREEHGLIKIGMTRRFDLRFRDLQQSIPYELSVVHLFETEKYVELEMWLHCHFSDKRVRGEWFCLSKVDLAEMPVLIQTWL